MSKPKPPSEGQNSIFLWLRPWFNSNVDAIYNYELILRTCVLSRLLPYAKQSNFCLLCHYFHQSNLNLGLHYCTFLIIVIGSVRVTARISLAIRDIIKKFEGIASAAEEIFLAFLWNIQKHHAS